MIRSMYLALDDVLFLRVDFRLNFAEIGMISALPQFGCSPQYIGGALNQASDQGNVSSHNSPILNTIMNRQVSITI